MQRTLIPFLVLASCLAPLQQKSLNNDDIVKMVKGGLSDDIILSVIELQPSNFDISPQALIELKQQGASKAILDKIIEVAAASRRDVAPPSQAQPQLMPPPSAPTQALSPTNEQRLRSLLEEAISRSRRLLTKPMEQNLHELLDQGLSGRDLPAAVKDSFVALFALYRQALHQFLEQEGPLLRQHRKKPSEPHSNLQRLNLSLRPVIWTGEKVFRNTGPSLIAGAEWQKTSQAYLDSPLWLLNSQPACGEKTTSQSASIGDVTETVTFVEWVDTPGSIASTGTAVTEMNIAADPKISVKGTKSGKISSRIISGACVDRCPTADGKVAGKSEVGWETIAELTATTEVATGRRELYKEDVTAQGHVGDDARLHEVVIQADINYEKRVGTELTILRWQGTATFNPDGSEREVPLQITGCSGNQGALPVSQCSAWKATVYVGVLQDAYLRAQRKWNLEQEAGTAYEPGSRCVIAKFTPPTDTVKASPQQHVPVKAELIALKGNQPSWGIFKELNPIPPGDGDIQEDGTRTSPDAAAQLTYTAPSKQWPCTDPPGFGVYRATSRAGALDLGDNGVGYTHDDWAWFLASGCLKLSIHERTEVQFMVVSMVGEVTFPMDVTVNEQGQIDGQAAVHREAYQQGLCVGVDRWMEQWHAKGTLDNTTDILALKLWFETSPRQGSFACPGPVTVPHTGPAFRSDGFPSPLDYFTLPNKEGATQHFVVTFGPATHTIDVTLLPPQGGAAVK